MIPHQGRILEFSLFSALEITPKQQHQKMTNKPTGTAVVILEKNTFVANAKTVLAKLHIES